MFWKRIGWLVIVLVISMVVINQAGFCQETEEAVAKGEEAVEEVKEDKGMTLWQVVSAGGWIMVIIGLCSILSMWFIIEHFINMRIKKIIPDGFVKKAQGFFEQKQYNELQGLCKKTPGLISNMIIAALDKVGQGVEMIREAVAESGEREESRLQRKISYLSMIATLSPMLGLLGTVLGMIQAFNVIAFSAGLGKPTLLAAGVSKALVTTAAGLIVAIPAMGFYFFFRNRVNLIIEMAEDIMTRFVEILTGRIPAPAAVKPPQPAVEPPAQEGKQE